MDSCPRTESTSSISNENCEPVPVPGAPITQKSYSELKQKGLNQPRRSQYVELTDCATFLGTNKNFSNLPEMQQKAEENSFFQVNQNRQVLTNQQFIEKLAEYMRKQEEYEMARETSRLKLQAFLKESQKNIEYWQKFEEKHKQRIDQANLEIDQNIERTKARIQKINQSYQQLAEIKQFRQKITHQFDEMLEKLKAEQRN